MTQTEQISISVIEYQKSRGCEFEKLTEKWDLSQFFAKLCLRNENTQSFDHDSECLTTSAAMKYL